MWFTQQLRRAKRLFFATPSGGQVSYALPPAHIYRKFYNQDQFFDEVDWSDWSSVVSGFENRFDKWYFAHLPGGNASYVDLAALCALVDVFSLHQSRTAWHSPRTYKEFLRKLDPAFRKRLPAPVPVSRFEAGSWRPGSLNDIADVFYAGVRCSLHHHGDLASYAGMTGTGQIAMVLPNAGRSLCGAFGYSLVVFDPAVLKSLLREWLRQYCETLRRFPRSDLADAFRSRLLADFGIVVP